MWVAPFPRQVVLNYIRKLATHDSVSGLESSVPLWLLLQIPTLTFLSDGQYPMNWSKPMSPNGACAHIVFSNRMSLGYLVIYPGPVSLAEGIRSVVVCFIRLSLFIALTLGIKSMPG